MNVGGALKDIKDGLKGMGGKEPWMATRFLTQQLDKMNAWAT